CLIAWNARCVKLVRTSRYVWREPSSAETVRLSTSLFPSKRRGIALIFRLIFRDEKPQECEAQITLSTGGTDEQTIASDEHFRFDAWNSFRADSNDRSCARTGWHVHSSRSRKGSARQPCRRRNGDLNQCSNKLLAYDNNYY